jgi:RNA polymerase sigma-70 factor, ECF subfamily
MAQQSEFSLHDLSSEDVSLLSRLKQGDELAFMTLVERYQASMIRLATVYVQERTLAEEVVQDTWIAVLRGLQNFEGRSSLKTWIFSILINRAKTHAQREDRYVTAGDLLSDDDSDADSPTVDPSRFWGAGSTDPGYWITYPNSWDEVPEERLLSDEVRQIIQAAINMLPAMQKQVITLRDVEDMDAEETCAMLSITDSNQRVLLHRARATVRQAVERYLDERDRQLVTNQ